MMEGLSRSFRLLHLSKGVVARSGGSVGMNGYRSINFELDTAKRGMMMTSRRSEIRQSHQHMKTINSKQQLSLSLSSSSSSSSSSSLLGEKMTTLLSSTAPRRQHSSTSSSSSSSSTTSTTASTVSVPLTIMHRGVELKVTPLSPGEDYRTQQKAVYKLPYYGASDDMINALSDMDAQRMLKCYGGLVKKCDTGKDWRTRLRRVTRAWHLPKQLTIRGTVVSNKMVKSVVVAARRRKWHKKLQMPYFRTRRFMAHDELNMCKEGDEVVIRSCRPLSKRKAHVVVVNYGDKLAVGGKDERRIDLGSVHEHFNLIDVEERKRQQQQQEEDEKESGNEVGKEEDIEKEE